MTESNPSLLETSISSCCADFYASDLARWLLGDSFHPGGVVLTGRLGVLLQLGATSKVLDVASGQGASAIRLAEQFGCPVVGLDISRENVARARIAGDRSFAPCQVGFITADAQQIPAASESFDAVICECSFCTFPEKLLIAQEFRRVLRPGGVLGLSDLTRRGSLPETLNGLLAHVLCVADARPVAEYAGALQRAGFHIDRTENHDDSLRSLVSQVRERLIGAKLVSSSQNVGVPGVDIDEALKVARAAAAAVDDGTLGYALITARK